MMDQKFSFSGSFNKLKEYIDTQIELVKLRSIARGSRILASLILDVSKILLMLLVVFFLAMALAFYLGQLFNNYALGFLAAGIAFALIIVIINVTKGKLELLLMDLTIRKVLGKWHEEDDHLEEDRLSRLRKKAAKAEEAAAKIKEEIEIIEDEHEQTVEK
ncbi:hypothetical protein [Sphingobacterium corticibacter]|uniref:hypothetical protein n=1 Tax=Sphingobacterium corticibacter TaxID=2171749 RepID=UPI001EF00C6A|nr:hypothetical protein [Sphingobacterium corticibacter]